MPARLPTTNAETNPQNNIRKIYFSLAHAYRHMISPTIPRIITVPRSGINKKIKKNIAFNMMNEMKKSLVFTLSRFLISHAQRKSTYPNLKNSAGCILQRSGIFIHPLEPLSTIPIPGMNTDICNTIRMMAMMVTFLLFWKNFMGIA